MLLELFELDHSLRGSGIVPEVTDQRIQPYPRRPAIEVRLTPEGRIAGIKLLDEEQVQAIRKFECSKGGLRESTPGFNVDPLWRMQDGNDPFEGWLKSWRKDWKSAATKPSQALKLLEARRDRRVMNWDLSPTSKLTACLKKAAATLRGELVGATDPANRGLVELLRRSEVLDAAQLHEALSAALELCATTGSGGLSLDDCRKFLYSDRDPGSLKPVPNESFSLVLELDDASAFGGCPANHQAVWEAANRYLISKQVPTATAQTADGEEHRARGIFGEPIPQSIGSMPERTLPRVGKIKLFSLSAQTPCQARYELIESAACPVGPELQDQLSAALNWICQPEREGKTWDDVSNACGYAQPALLLAYPSTMTANPPGLTGMMTSRRPGSQAPQAARFAARANMVVQAIEGVRAENPDLSVTVVVIAKADTARKKLLYSRWFSARRLVAAAEEWQEAARNTPPIAIRIFEDGQPVWRRPPTPFPDQVIRLVNTCWNSDGEKPQAVSNARIGAALALLLETGPPLKQAVDEALRPLVCNVTPLVLALARAHGENRVAKALNANDLPLFMPSILGLLLAKAGHRKGDYMSHNSYLIGRLLNLADEFHRNYCKHERDGKYPPQLIGNALMPTALESPVAGLARLAERLPLYQRVANRDLRAQAEAVEQAINKTMLPTRCSDADKAQMLLGYLARTSSDDQATDEPDDVPNMETES